MIATREGKGVKDSRRFDRNHLHYVSSRYKFSPLFLLFFLFLSQYISMFLFLFFSREVCGRECRQGDDGSDKKGGIMER